MKKQYNLMVTEAVLEKMNQHCESNGIKKNFFVEAAIKEKLENYGIKA